MQNQLSRRAALTGIGLAGATALIPVAGAALATVNGSDAHILDAWNRRQRALAEIEARGDYFDAETDSPAAADAYDKADAEITRATATTPRGLLAQAWVAASYAQDSFTALRTRQNTLIRRADYQGLLAERDHLEWEVQTQLAVIRSLRIMVGEG